jgi:hypothetical protein
MPSPLDVLRQNRTVECPFSSLARYAIPDGKSQPQRISATEPQPKKRLNRKKRKKNVISTEGRNLSWNSRIPSELWCLSNCVDLHFCRQRYDAAAFSQRRRTKWKLPLIN